MIGLARFESLPNDGVIGVVGIANFFLLDRLRLRSTHLKATKSRTPPADATTIPAISPVESNMPVGCEDGVVEELDDTFCDGSAFGNALGVGVMTTEDVLGSAALDDDADIVVDVSVDVPTEMLDDVVGDVLVELATLEVLVWVEAPLKAVEDAAISASDVDRISQRTKDSVAL
jgi:hypothetical protein